MPQTETVPLHDTPSLTEAAVSRRALLTAGAGLAATAAIASSTAQAQAPGAAPPKPPDRGRRPGCSAGDSALPRAGTGAGRRAANAAGAGPGAAGVAGQAHRADPRT